MLENIHPKFMDSQLEYPTIVIYSSAEMSSLVIVRRWKPRATPAQILPLLKLSSLIIR